MVEVLILSYNALPMDVVSSYRAKGYCDHLVSSGIRPTLVTHRWEAGDSGFRIHKGDDAVLVEERETCRIIRLPFPGVNTSLSRLHTIVSYLRGDLDVSLSRSYQIFRKFLFDHLSTNRYHLIIGIYNPHFHLKLAYECGRKFGIPYALDFRDLWNNEIITASYRPTLKAKITDAAILFWWRRWIRQSLFFSTTGEKWKKYLSRISGENGIVVRNGFEQPSESLGTRGHGKRFTIVHFGRMYPRQDISIFIQGFKDFAAGIPPSEVTFEVIGLKKVAGFDFHDQITKALGSYVRFQPYMPKDELIRYCAKEATLLFFPDFREDNGSFAVKVYDYLVIGKNILVAPGGGEVSRLVTELNAGAVLNDAGSVAAYLRKCYQEYRTTGSVNFSVNNRRLEKYSRKTQVAFMAEKIKEALSKR